SPKSAQCATNQNTNTALENNRRGEFTVVTPKHPSLPELPTINGLAFEALFFGYLLTALFGQYIFIYKTVWWYPNTLPPSNTTINFHLIDQNLTAFLIILFSRRVLWTLLWDHLRPGFENAMLLLLWIIFSVALWSVWLIELIKNLYVLYSIGMGYKLLFLCYPMILWIPLCGLAKGNKLNQLLQLLQKSKPRNKSHNLPNCANKYQYQPDSLYWAKDAFNSLDNMPDPDQIRERTVYLRNDFNLRMAEIVFGSMICSYYIGLVPMFFTKSNYSYDVLWSLQHTASVLINSFAMMTYFLFPPSYLESLHKCASVLGGFRQVDPIDLEHKYKDDIVTYKWNPSSAYPEGVVIKVENKLYYSFGQYNTANPVDSSHYRFYSMFVNPLRILNWQLGLHLSAVVLQIHVLLWSSKWDQLIVPALLQFFSYYILFATLRDRIVLGKVYS
uniref:Transmembrane protein 39A n=1 Tax=Ciona savignyi TaxID=51511 RepID=H2Z4W4_CIOSA